ncbi:YjcB family protein [Shigella sonnei]
MMFLASTLNIRFRRLIMSGLQLLAAVLGLVCLVVRNGVVGITMADITAIWHNIESVMVEEMNQTPPQGAMILT